MTSLRTIGFIVIAFVLGVLAAREGMGVPVAQADQTRSAVCTPAIKPTSLPARATTDILGPLYAAPMSDWMNQQIAAGRTQFTVAPGDNIGMLICAW